MRSIGPSVAAVEVGRGMVGVQADRPVVVGDGCLDPVQIGVVQTGAGPPASARMP